MDLDTKELLDLYAENGIKATADYGEGITYSDEADAAYVELVRRHILTNAETLDDYIDDLMVDMMEDREMVAKIVPFIAESFRDVKRLQDHDGKDNSPSYQLTISRCLTSQLADISASMMASMHKALTAALARGQEQALVDMANYVADMERDHADDMAYELTRDHA